MYKILIFVWLLLLASCSDKPKQLEPKIETLDYTITFVKTPPYDNKTVAEPNEHNSATAA